MVDVKEKISTLSLPLMEDFYTIQGEGAYQGHAAYFIRLGGCEVRCVWCDVKDSWDVNAHEKVKVSDMALRAKASGAKIVVVTGGEPTMHNLVELTRELKKQGLNTHIESSGAYPLTGEWDWVCFSPKKFKAPDLSFPVHANELKVVIFHKKDFEWALEYANKVRSECELYLQPEWSREKEMLPMIIDFVKANPRWKISLQVHKYMNIP